MITYWTEISQFYGTRLLSTIDLWIYLKPDAVTDGQNMPKKVINPLARYVCVSSVSTLVVLGLAMLLGLHQVLELLTKPLLFVCFSLFIAYTIWALRIGVVSNVDRWGRVSEHTRAKEPVFFHFIVILYLLLSVPAALYIGAALIGY